MPDASQIQTVFYLGILANAASVFTGTVEEIELLAYGSVSEQLLAAKPYIGAWELVWGPAVFQVFQSKIADNAMYAFKAGPDTPFPGQIVVGIAGTNPYSIFDWLVEDLWVATSVPWEYGSPGPQLKPRLALGTHVGLKILQSLKPGAGIPGFGTTLAEFLAGASSGAGLVTVAGHSLGGALTVPVSLWLSDIQSEWNPGGKTALASQPSAGPTSGNKDFATYYDSQLGSSTIRIHNSLDVVSHAWTAGQVLVLPGLYEPDIQATLESKILAAYAVSQTAAQQYTQVLASAPPLPGKINTGIIDPQQNDCVNYIAQALYQHTSAYYSLLGLTGDTDSILVPLRRAAAPGSDPVTAARKVVQRRVAIARQSERLAAAKKQATVSK